MLKTGGYLLLEVLMALVLVSGMSLAIYQSLLAELALSQQLLARQYMLQAANALANQIYAHLAYTCLNDPPNFVRSASYMPSSFCPPGGLSMFSEIKFNGSSGEPSCDSCTAVAYAKYTLWQWQQALKHLPLANIFGLVCVDNDNYAQNIPTLLQSNCAANGRNLVIKMLWQAPTTAGKTVNSYYILRVPSQ